MMEQWRVVILERFGKKARHKWYRTALDFQLVDLGIKPSCLFDYWSVSPEDMKLFTQDLYKQCLTNSKLHVLTIGQDVVIYSLACGQIVMANSSECSYMDATLHLPNPILACREKVSSTIDIFDKLCVTMSDNCDDQAVVQDLCIDIEDRLNVPCLFGLLLGYPCVYWYDVTKGDDHCLSGQVLHLFQVKGHLKTMKEHLMKLENVINTSLERNAGKPGSTDNFHVIFSFSVPVCLLENVKDHVLCWFSKWKDLTMWSHLFYSVWLEEKTVSPQSVCL